MKKQDNVIIGIYKITNPNGKIYIGQSINIEYRKERYKRKHCKNQPKIYNSLKKYGWESHKFEIIEECSIELLNEREVFYKQQLIDGFGWELTLFCNIFDMGGGPLSEETKLKISNGNKGKINSEEHRLKISKSNKGLSRNKGNKVSLETKNKISNSKMGQPVDALKIKVLQYDVMGNFIKCWDSIQEASKETKTHQGDISSCCTKNLKSANNFQWVYFKEDTPLLIHPLLHKGKNITIYQFDLDNKLVRKWNSIKEATEYIGASSGSICSCCKGKLKTYKGYKWSYKNIQKI